MTSRLHLSALLAMFFHIFTLSLTGQEIQADQVLDNVVQQQQQSQPKIDAAYTAMEAVQRAGAYIESLSDLIGNGEITLPVGIKKGAYELIVHRLSLDEVTGKTTIYATCAFKFREDGQVIAFEGSTVLEGQRGLGTHGYLKLIAPIRRNLGEQVAIVFNSGTQVNFGCDGIESFLASINLFITSDKITPVDKEGKPRNGYVMSSFKANFYDFDNYTVSFSFNQSFCFKGLNDVIFTLKGATLDQSDTMTYSTVRFPTGYFNGQNPSEIRLWKGIAITEATIALPAIFKKSSVSNDTTPTDSSLVHPNRIVLGLNNVLFDNNGFTGSMEARDVMNSDAIDKTKWDITVTDVLLSVLKNNISGFGFGGDLNIPPLGNTSLLPYTARFNPAIDEYEFTVNVSGEYDFPVLYSTLTLDETSTIDVLFRGSDIYPTLDATGKITINAPLSASDSTKTFSLPDVSFQNLKISRSDPYLEIGAIGITGEFRSPKVAGFELSISNILPFNDGSGSGLSFDAGVKLNDMFGGTAGIMLYGDYAKWKFDRVGLSKIEVDFQSKAFSVFGGVYFKNGDSIYGTGFRGEVNFILVDKFKLDAVAIFGKKDDYRYFLTDVFFEMPPGTGITIPPVLAFYGFGGGLYRKMQQSGRTDIDAEFGKSLSGITYVPDKTVGMGFMTATKFSFISSATMFDARVGFEIQFNENGGLNFIQLRGEASFIDDPLKMGKLAENINKQVQKLEEVGGKIKLSAKDDLQVPENKAGGFLTASLNIKYDIANKIFAADLSAYLNAGFIKGVGENDRMGWASAYFSPDKWYTYIGTPTDRLGVEILGLARLDGYFMIGDDIPELPPPPQKVLQNFSPEKQAKICRRSSEDATSGSGLAFGVSLSFEFQANYSPFYAHIGLGLGSEFLLKNYGVDAYCAGGSTTLGINGWYARAQAWAWVEADIGLKANIFGKSRQFSILALSAGAYMMGAGPNPFYFTGAVGGRFSVMGGLLSGQCDFDFEIGHECIIISGSPFGTDIIAQLTPAPGEEDVNSFVSPQVVFNLPVGLEMQIEEAEGLKAWYIITLEDFKVYYKDNNQRVEGTFQLSDDGKIYVLDPYDPLESQKDMVAYAKVGFKRKLNGQWMYVKGNDGNPVYEIKEVAFKSGDRPKEILPEHVKLSYPVARQYNYYPKEYNQGYIWVTENYSYLFTDEKPEGFDQKLRITDPDGKSQTTSFSYKNNPAGSAVRLEISFSTASFTFTNDEIYKLAIVNIPQVKNTNITSNITTNSTTFNNNDSILMTTSQAEGSLEMLEEKEIYALQFRTSKYNTFREKMAGINNYEGVPWQEYPHVYLLGSNIYDPTSPTELFDFNELNSINANLSQVVLKPVYDNTPWYKNKVEPLMYGNTELLAQAGMAYLKPPVGRDVVKFSFWDMDTRLTDDMIKSGSRANLYTLGAYNYRASYYIDRDFVALRNALANKLVSSNNATTGTAKFLNADNIPDLSNGNYKIQLDYTLPGKGTTTSTYEETIELSGFID